jgi:LmbE family N-acetylglucosaminyl deacetylase
MNLRLIVFGWMLALAVLMAGVLYGAAPQAPAEGVTDAGAAAGAAAGASVQSKATVTEAKRPADGKLRIIAFGAHPDDAEIRVGGAAILWGRQGHHVKLVSVTNGDIGHFRQSGPALAARRYQEVQEAAKILGTITAVLDIHDGELMPSLENRRAVTRLIRDWNADIVIAHRPNDYHPDHRYTGMLIQDAAFMVTVPFFCPETPYLRENPVFLYSYDQFERPNPFRPDVVVAIDSVIEPKLDALLKIESQFVEGGALGYRRPEPQTADQRQARREEARETFRQRFAATADRCRSKLIDLYGPEDGARVRFAEAFEVCEYGRKPTPEELRKLFPFFPQGK